MLSLKEGKPKQRKYSLTIGRRKVASGAGECWAFWAPGGPGERGLEVEIRLENEKPWLACCIHSPTLSTSVHFLEADAMVVLWEQVLGKLGV